MKRMNGMKGFITRLQERGCQGSRVTGVVVLGTLLLLPWYIGAVEVPDRIETEMEKKPVQGSEAEINAKSEQFHQSSKGDPILNIDCRVCP